MGHLSPGGLQEGDPEGGDPKRYDKGYIERDVKMSCKRVSLSTGVLLGNLEENRSLGLFGRKG